MYYFIEYAYCGQADRPDASHAEIRTDPDGLREPFGFRPTDDYAIIGRGAYATQEEAEAAIREQYDEVRNEADVSGCYPFDPAVVRRYRLGRYEHLTAAATREWIYPALARVTADDTDDDLLQQCVDLQNDAHLDGLHLRGAEVLETLFRHRDELVALQQ